MIPHVLTLAAALATAERERDAALASADLSARAAVDAARELGHVAAAAIARADAADARSATLLMCGEAAERAATEAHAQHAALVAAVRAEREAERGHAAVRADDASRGRHLRAAEAAVDKARHATDALLSAAPAPTTVPAEVVRAYLRADARSATGTHADATALAAARTALDAALAGCA